jgi:hypothetical protein
MVADVTEGLTSGNARPLDSTDNPTVELANTQLASGDAASVTQHFVTEFPR